jgi:hypothetical protein
MNSVLSTRRSPRIAAHHLASYSRTRYGTQVEPVVLLARTVDLSAGGAKLETEGPLQTGDRLNLQIAVRNRVIEVTATVVHVRPQSDSLYATGVEFDRLGDDERSALLGRKQLQESLAKVRTPPVAGPAAPRWARGDAEALADPEVAAALAGVENAPPHGEHDEVTGLSEGQIRMLPVGVRIKLSRRASHTLRSILLRDSYPLVALSVLEHTTWSDHELEQLARNRSVVVEVLDRMAHKREWVHKYPIALALVSNPRTPVPAALKLLPLLAARDLRTLSHDRNIADAVRSSATRMSRMKTTSQ